MDRSRMGTSKGSLTRPLSATPAPAPRLARWSRCKESQRPRWLQVTVKPVIDLNDHVHVTQYEIPDRLQEAAALRDVTCVFPFCTRPARTCRGDEHHADCDHVTPYDPARTSTCSCHLAPLCRRHHRLKTHGGWHCAPSSAAPTCGPRRTGTA